MPANRPAPTALLGIQHLTFNQIQLFIERALKLKSGQLPLPSTVAGRGSASPIVALVFFEPSTRTRFSFEMAVKRLRLNPITYVADASTSQVKGESLHETLQTILCMRPDLLVVRHPGDEKIRQILSQAQVPVINAGDGLAEHPTQALLDAMTIIECHGQIKGQRVLFVGDVEHSRVARSNRILLQKLGAEVAVCAPESFLPTTDDWFGVKQFSHLTEGAAWATVCMGLRIQKERHGKSHQFSIEDYVRQFKLSESNLKTLSSQAIIMHPGPFVMGVDLDEEVLLDRRCQIHRQVENGVYMRMSIIGELLGLFDT